MSNKLLTGLNLYGANTFDEVKEIIESHVNSACAITVRNEISEGNVHIPAWTTFMFPTIVLNSGIWGLGFQLNDYRSCLLIRDMDGTYKTHAL